MSYRPYSILNLKLLHLNPEHLTLFNFCVSFLCQEPLNSGDDVSDEEDQELFDTENVVVCQYDKVGNDLLCERIHQNKT